MQLLTFLLGSCAQTLISDPEGIRTDAELISILQRAWLLPKDGLVDPAVEAKFSLDSAVSDEGPSPICLFLDMLSPHTSESGRVQF